MAEQINKNDYLNHPDKLGTLNYYSLGETTVKQLQQYKLISSKTRKHQANKPDALVTNDRGEVLVYIENKDIGKLDSKEDIKKAYEQEFSIAKEIKAKIYLLTDTKKSLWYNVQTGNEILDNNSKPLRIVFNPHANKKDLEKLILNIINSISDDSDRIQEIEYLDPSDLATSIHQKLWIAKNTSPETSLYTFIELFIFKYLSDLEVLTNEYSFDNLYQKYEQGNEDEYVLDFYLGSSGPREYIKGLFPAGSDKTTIVNGDIFHTVKDENGDYIVNGDGKTFRLIMEEFRKYELKFGKFKNINKDFKSKLFESFLKNEKDKKKMGQFFTPLKVVEQMIRMIDIKEGMKICDPASGVGKFLLEAVSNDIDNFYKFKNIKENGKNKIILDKKVELLGIDKYSEDNSDRTIILAKANMLIYFSKLISEHPDSNHTRIISKELLNPSFQLKRTNLGTLEDLQEKEYDLILTNPPYVVNGSKDIKEAAISTNQYHYNALGLEGLFMEWIIKSLKEGGEALIVIPDGILTNFSNKKLRENLLDLCILQGIISLPINTFFGTPKKTYILSIKRKFENDFGKTHKQEEPVFTYICNSIGETLDSYRFETDNNHLEEGVNQYRLFKAYQNKSDFKAITYDEKQNPIIDKKCKLVEIDFFYNHVETSWDTDKLWSDEEKIELGFKSKSSVMTPNDFINYIDEIVESMNDFKGEIECLKKL